MTEQKLLVLFIQERINMLIDTFHKVQPKKCEMKKVHNLQAEFLIESLPSKEKELIENYIDSFIKRIALEADGIEF